MAITAANRWCNLRKCKFEKFIIARSPQGKTIAQTSFELLATDSAKFVTESIGRRESERTREAEHTILSVKWVSSGIVSASIHSRNICYISSVSCFSRKTLSPNIVSIQFVSVLLCCSHLKLIKIDEQKKIDSCIRARNFAFPFGHLIWAMLGA